MYRYRNVGLAVTGAIAAAGCAAIVVHLPAPVMVILGIGLFAAPGYAWSEVLLSPRVSALERVVVAATLALIVPVLGGLVLTAARIPLHRDAWIGLLAAAAGTGAVVAAFQRRTTELPAARQQPRRGRLPVGHAIAFGAAAVIATGAVTLAVVSAEAQKYTPYTQLWMSPAGAKAVTASTASLGVTNQQGSTEQYRLVLRRKGRVSATWNFTLANDQTWQRTIPFTMKSSITADLYQLPNLSTPYRKVDNGI
jgi:hypothetical protein